jgi:hypothetical protein
MPRHATRLALVVAALALAVGAAACGGSGPSARPSPSVTTGAPAGASAGATAAPATPTAETPRGPAPTRVPGGNDRTPLPSPATFETVWGTAWDALPPGFPVPPRSRPADPGDPSTGPVSGAFVVDVSAGDAVAREQVGLAAAGYSTEALSGPAEDGSLVIDSVGRDPACRVQTTVRPLGGTTMITVLYGAACPWG